MRANKQIANGTLRRVLSDFELASDSAIWALYPKSKHVLPKLRVFLDFLGEWFRDARGDTSKLQPKAVANSVYGPESKSDELLRARMGNVRAVSVTRGNGGIR